VRDALIPALSPIEPGCLARLGELVHPAVGAARYAVVVDANVAESHGAAAATALRTAGAAADLVVFDAGEASKTRATWAALTDRLMEQGVGRDGCVVAVGGGVTLDLAGFVAATYMRGVPLVLVPTSLLAMVDAAWGAKTGVDTDAGKNLVGAFHRPAAIVVDPQVLQTLPDVELRHGLAEAVKHAALADAAHLDWIVERAARVVDRDPAVLAALVARSAAIKRSFVEADPFERGQRAALNFGHTIGHAVERVTSYGVPHGAAVALGMVAEAAIGEAAGITAPGSADALRTALLALGLPVRPPPQVVAGDVIAAAGTDKKARAGRVRFALIAALGEVARGPDGGWTLAVEAADVAAVLARLWSDGASPVSAERSAV
jgi:3-dehydroquinate synthase